MGKRNDWYKRAINANLRTENLWRNRLLDLALSTVRWINLPNTVSARFLEYTLNTRGECAFFEDEVMGFLCLPLVNQSSLSVYNEPLKWLAYANNGYSYACDVNNSVIIHNNLSHNSDCNAIDLFAVRLATLDRIIDLNVDTQKMPRIFKGTESEQLTLQNLFLQVDAGLPAIFTDKDAFNADNVKILNCAAPFIADKVHALKEKIWLEALTYLGIDNQSVEKAERVTNTEISMAAGGLESCRRSRIMARENACIEINKMFGLNIHAEYAGEGEKTQNGDLYEDAARDM